MFHTIEHTPHNIKLDKNYSIEHVQKKKIIYLSITNIMNINLFKINYFDF